MEDGKRNAVKYTEINKRVKENIKENKKKQEAKMERLMHQNKNRKCPNPQLGKIQR